MVVIRRIRKRKVKDFIIGLMIGTIYGVLFIGNLWAIVPAGLFQYVFMKKRQKEWETENKRRMAMEFKEALQAIYSGIYVGYSVERAMCEVKVQLESLYGTESVLLPEFVQMEHELSVQKTAEQCFVEFGERTGVQEIQLFAQVFATAKRTGGDIAKVIHNTSEKIQERIELEQQARALIGEKRAESKVMNCIPLFMIMYMRLTSPKLMEQMYTGVGQIVMCVCLGIYVGCYILGEYIIEHVTSDK